MKNNVLLLLPLTIVLFAACEKEIKSYNLAIDLQFSFKQDNVKVFIDDIPHFDRNVTTSQSLGYSGTTITSLNSGLHQLKVVINDSLYKTAHFPMNTHLFIGIQYNHTTREISFDYSNQPFAYN